MKEIEVARLANSVAKDWTLPLPPTIRMYESGSTRAVIRRGKFIYKADFYPDHSGDSGNLAEWENYNNIKNTLVGDIRVPRMKLIRVDDLYVIKALYINGKLSPCFGRRCVCRRDPCVVDTLAALEVTTGICDLEYNHILDKNGIAWIFDLGFKSDVKY